MKKAFLTSAQRSSLEEHLRQTDDISLCHRLLALLEIDWGRSVSDAARFLHTDRRSVQRWLKRYRSHGSIESLQHRPGQGRPALWSEELEGTLHRLLAQPPAKLGYAATGWTAPLLQAALPGPQPFSCRTIRRHLQDAGYVWKRFRYVLAPDPEQEKKREIRRQIRRLPPQTALLTQDETDLLLFPPLRAGWARRGEPAPALISGQNARRIVFGALNLRTGQALFLDQQRRRIQEFQEFLDLVHWHYRARPAALLLDENSIHTALESQSLAEDLDIHLLWLPKRSPHLNPMDHLWRHGKARICANQQHASLDLQTFDFIHYYQTLSTTERLRKAGVLSKHFGCGCDINYVHPLRLKNLSNSPLVDCSTNFLT